MKFNDKQIEDVVRMLYTIASAAIIGVTVGISGHTQLSKLEITAMTLSSIILIGMALYLRRSK